MFGCTCALCSSREELSGKIPENSGAELRSWLLSGLYHSLQVRNHIKKLIDFVQSGEGLTDSERDPDKIFNSIK